MAVWDSNLPTNSQGNPNHGGPLPMDDEPLELSSLSLQIGGGVSGEGFGRNPIGYGRGSSLGLGRDPKGTMGDPGSVSRKKIGSDKGSYLVMDEARSSYCVIADSSYGLHSSSTTYTGNLVRAIIESMAATFLDHSILSDEVLQVPQFARGAHGGESDVGKDAEKYGLQHDPVMGSLRAASRIRYVEIEDSCDCITDDACDGVTAGSNIDGMNKKAEHIRGANKFDRGLSQ
ncbi:hypothetical protein AMTR_s00980p00007280 [Amborella trichopoda]|uniref:Uncharacterized protein n=1 Tax=Amborella trichopoda TaxID=13333 RepID=W1P050_AMBTC|nr:hypothetical protein AMTR_s00980p00007280 [Amborella trichopoda]